MHLYFFVRGIENQVALWKILAQSHFWKWRRKDLKTGKETIHLLQGGLRPTIFGAYEYIFPEEAIEDVLAVFGAFDDGDTWAQNFPQAIGWAALRKGLGCEKIPKEIFEAAKKKKTSVWFTDSERAFSHSIVGGVHLHVIGIKRDKFGDMLDTSTGETYTQELI